MTTIVISWFDYRDTPCDDVLDTIEFILDHFPNISSIYVEYRMVRNLFPYKDPDMTDDWTPSRFFAGFYDSKLSFPANRLKLCPAAAKMEAKGKAKVKLILRSIVDAKEPGAGWYPSRVSRQ